MFGNLNKSLAGCTKTVACPNCGGTISIRALGISISAICQSCGSLIDVANEDIRLIQEAMVKTRQYVTMLGMRGKLFDVDWEIIGYCERTDGAGGYEWHEYLLFNPYQGFRFLVHAEGHWNFVKVLRRAISPVPGINRLHFDGLDYRLYLRGDAVVKYVIGEFYWRVKVGDKVQVADYVAPPYMLSMEQSTEEVIWSQSLYVDKKEIEQAFGLDEMASAPKGIAPNEPSPFIDKLKRIRKLWALFLTTLLAIQLFSVYRSLNQTVYEQKVHAPSSSQGQFVISEPINLAGGIGNVEIFARSLVDNNWVELSISLVNDATQESYDITQVIEHYRGIDGGGVWSEGGNEASTVMPSIPGGQYHLLVQPDAGIYRAGQPIDFTIKVTRDVPVWSSFLLTLFALSLYPLYVLLRYLSFESRRWANSDFSPTIKTEYAYEYKHK